jgi:hypothetical protein
MPLPPHLLELITSFNRQKTDLPDGAMHKACVFRLNGLAYHEQLGRPADDPLVRLIGCGPGGYRFILAALRHAVHEPRLAVDEETTAEDRAGDASRLRARGRLTGRLRGSGRDISAECLLEVTADGDAAREIAVTLGDADLELLREARRQP